MLQEDPPRKTPARKLPAKNVFGYFSEKNMNVVNGLANRVSMKKTGKVTLKSRKKIKVSKGLREKVKKVIAGQDAYGEYNTRIGGLIGYVDPGVSAVTTQQETIQRDTSFCTLAWAGAGALAGSKCWFGGLYTNVAGNATSLSGGQFVFFTPSKILNAASVLWNGKAASQDWDLVAGNFSLNQGFTTGTPQVGSITFPQAGALEIRVINSYARWLIKNTNQRTMRLKIYHCVPKVKYAQSGPLTALVQSSDITDTTTIRRKYSSSTIATGGGTVQSSIFCHPLFEPNKYDQFSNVYTYQKTEINLKPGEEFVHMVQGPKNYTLDYTKLMNSGISEIGSFYKGCSKVCMVSVELDAVSTITAASYTGGQYFAKSAGANPLVINPVSIEIDEVYKLACPKNTGFISIAAAAGTVQTNNLVADRIIYNNFNPAVSTAAASDYQTYNEENPGAVMAESTSN